MLTSPPMFPCARPTLWHEAPLAAVIVLVVNDHLLKGAGVVPGWLTGKLSDVAGLFFFPVLLAVVAWPLAQRARVRPAVVPIACASVTALAFAAVKTSPAVATWVATFWGAMACDPTDLVALPMAAASGLWMTRRDPARTTTRAGELVAVLAAAAASIATSPARYPPCYATPPQRSAVGWDKTCASTAGMSVVLAGGQARLRLALHVEGDGRLCTLPLALGLAIDDGRGRHADIELPSASRTLQGDDVLTAEVALPFAATCAMVTSLVTTEAAPVAGAAPTAQPDGGRERALLATPVASCAEGEAP